MYFAPHLRLRLLVVSAGTCRRQAHEDLEGVVNHPLQASECTNHDDTNRETVPETRESDILVDSAHGSTKAFPSLSVGVEFADHDIGGMGDDSAENTGEVTTDEGDTSLLALGVIVLGTWESGVDHLNDGLEGGEFHHGVWDLSAPKRIDTLVETARRVALVRACSEMN